jgi:hypothetical protein
MPPAATKKHRLPDSLAHCGMSSPEFLLDYITRDCDLALRGFCRMYD